MNKGSKEKNLPHYERYLKGKTLCILFGEESIKEIEKKSIELGNISRADIVRIAVREYFNRENELKNERKEG